TRGKKAGEDTPPLPELEDGKAEGAPSPQRAKAAEVARTWSVFARGWQVLRNALAVGLLLLGSWQPEPWPDHPAFGLPPTHADPAASANATGQAAARPPPSCVI